MKLVDYVRLARRRWVIIVAGLLLGLSAAGGYASTIPETYTASSTVYVSMATGTSVNDSYQGGLAAQQRVRSYLTLATSDTVAKRVVGQLGLKVSPGDVQSRITVTSPPASTLVRVTATDKTAAGARDLANEVVAQFRWLVDSLETIEQSAAPAARVAVVDSAQLPTGPTGPKTTRILALGVLAGLALGAGTAYLLDRSDRRVRSREDLAAIGPVPVLGAVDLGGLTELDGFRQVRARLTPHDKPTGATKTVLLTSFSSTSRPDVAIGLARSLGDTGRHVILVDADTTGRGCSSRLPEASGLGLSGLLRHGKAVGDAVEKWPESDIWVLPLGAIDRQTPDLLSSARFEKILFELGGMFDDILVDTAPVTTTADALAIAPRCAMSVGVVTLDDSTETQIHTALTDFGAVSSNLIGTVVVPQTGTAWERLIRGLRK